MLDRRSEEGKVEFLKKMLEKIEKNYLIKNSNLKVKINKNFLTCYKIFSSAIRKFLTCYKKNSYLL